MASKITALETQQKNQRRVNVYLDGQFAFGLQDGVAAKLRVGQALSAEQVASLQAQDAAEVAYERALDYLTFRPRSRAEVQAYLERHKVALQAAEQVVERLAAAGLLDDQAFARYWVDNREHFRPRGARALRYELRRKGVCSAEVEAAVAQVDESEGAYRAAVERARRIADQPYEVFHRRLSAFLQRRGFGYDVVRETVDRLWKELRSPAEEGRS